MPPLRAPLLALVLCPPLLAAEPPANAPPADKPAHTASAPDLSQGAFAFAPGVSGVLEVKKAKTGHLLVRPKVNAHSPGWFIFDTGAGICVVSSAVKDSLGLTEVGDLDAIGVGGRAKTTMYRADTVVLGPLTLNDHPVMVTDLSFLTPHLGDEIAGVIGYGVLSRCIVELSLSEPRIALHDPKTYTLTAGAWEEMKVTDRIPNVKGSIEGNEGRFRLDTGANSGVTVHAAAVERWKLLEGRDTVDAKLGGVGGFVEAKRGTLRDVTVGGVKNSDVKADFATAAKGTFGESAYDANIGAGLLSKYTLILDYAGERVCFRPVAP